MDNIFTDRDGINLSDIVYQDIDSFKDYDTIKDACFDNNDHVKIEIKQDFPDFAKRLETFPNYYFPTFENY